MSLLLQQPASPKISDSLTGRQISTAIESQRLDYIHLQPNMLVLVQL
jgi:hypothetical protein